MNTMENPIIDTVNKNLEMAMAKYTSITGQLAEMRKKILGPNEEEPEEEGPQNNSVTVKVSEESFITQLSSGDFVFPDNTSEGRHVETKTNISAETAQSKEQWGSDIVEEKTDPEPVSSKVKSQEKVNVFGQLFQHLIKGNQKPSSENITISDNDEISSDDSSVTYSDIEDSVENIFFNEINKVNETQNNSKRHCESIEDDDSGSDKKSNFSCEIDKKTDDMKEESNDEPLTLSDIVRDINVEHIFESMTSRKIEETQSQINERYSTEKEKPPKRKNNANKAKRMHTKEKVWDVNQKNILNMSETRSTKGVSISGRKKHSSSTLATKSRRSAPGKKEKLRNKINYEVRNKNNLKKLAVLAQSKIQEEKHFEVGSNKQKNIEKSKKSNVIKNVLGTVHESNIRSNKNYETLKFDRSVNKTKFPAIKNDMRKENPINIKSSRTDNNQLKLDRKKLIPPQKNTTCTKETFPKNNENKERVTKVRNAFLTLKDKNEASRVTKKENPPAEPKDLLSQFEQQVKNMKKPKDEVKDLPIENGVIEKKAIPERVKSVEFSRLRSVSQIKTAMSKMEESKAGRRLSTVALEPLKEAVRPMTTKPTMLRSTVSKEKQHHLQQQEQVHQQHHEGCRIDLAGPKLPSDVLALDVSSKLHFPFILGKSASKSFNIQANIQQITSLVRMLPKESIERNLHEEVDAASTKISTRTTEKKETRCPACNEVESFREDDPWDNSSKNFVRCTCMFKNMMSSKMVLRQLLHQSCPGTLSCAESTVSTIEEKEAKQTDSQSSLTRRHDLAKLLHATQRFVNNL